MLSPQDVGKRLYWTKGKLLQVSPLLYFLRSCSLGNTVLLGLDWSVQCSMCTSLHLLMRNVQCAVHIAHPPSSPDVIFIRPRQRRERQRREPPFISWSSSDHKRQYSATWRRDWWEFPAFCLQNFSAPLTSLWRRQTCGNWGWTIVVASSGFTECDHFSRKGEPINFTLIFPML